MLAYYRSQGYNDVVKDSMLVYYRSQGYNAGLLP